MKKEHLKTIGLCLLAWVFLLGWGSVILGIKDENKTEQTQEITETEAETETKTEEIKEEKEEEIEEKTEEETQETEESELNLTQEEKDELIRTMLDASFRNAFKEQDVEYEIDMDLIENCVTIKEKVNGLAIQLMQAKNGDEASIEGWIRLTEALAESSESLHKTVAEIDEKKNVSIMVLNDINPDNVLISALNGVIVVNALEE